MLKKNVIAIIPAKGNSKRISGKNYKKFDGKPIIAYTIEKLKKSGIFDRIIVSTDSKKIASILELDLDNPYIEIIEVKKNKTFIAKKSEIFEEEKNVSEKAPVDEIKMDDLTKTKDETLAQLGKFGLL